MQRPNKAKTGNAVTITWGSERKWELNLIIILMGGVFLVLVMSFPVAFFSVSARVSSNLSWGGLWPVVVDQNNLADSNLEQGTGTGTSIPIGDENENENENDDELLPTGFVEQSSCLSRYESHLYRRRSPKKASASLISKLRSYEVRHKKCGPHTESYNKTVEHLRRSNISSSSSSSDCNYIVVIPIRGWGNRILSLTSAFLYALLTDRVLLVDRGGVHDIDDLFCEPFPQTSWLLPLDFPLTKKFRTFDERNSRSNNSVNSSSSSSSSSAYMYIHLLHDGLDRQFFCDEDQAYLQRIPWLVIRSNNYFTPSFFLMPSFEQELHRLFPDKETVFHLLGRYLLHPTNSVWGLITRYYDAYLSTADQIVGIQLRLFIFFADSDKHILDQILSCTTTEKILPEIPQHQHQQQQEPRSNKNKTVISVVITSLTRSYSKKIWKLYLDNPTETGDEVVAVFQPSEEGYEQTEKQNHNRKAWAEMYLLSLTDKLVTTPWSTFGYVAQGLGGLRPWILTKPENQTTPKTNNYQPCRRAMSMEPCCHVPPDYNCKTRTFSFSSAVVPYVRSCEDFGSSGVKLFQH